MNRPQTMKTMYIYELAYTFISSALKAVEVKIALIAVTVGAVVETATVTPISIHTGIYLQLEHISIVCKTIVYGGGAVAFIYKGAKGAFDWWENNKK